MTRNCVSVCDVKPCVRQVSCKWIEFVAHLYIGRWIVFINDVTEEYSGDVVVVQRGGCEVIHVGASVLKGRCSRVRVVVHGG